MTILANVLYPAFMSPHVAAIFLPLSGLMAFAAEVLIYRHFNKGQYFWFIVWCVLFLNCVSSSFGMWLSGSVPEIVKLQGGFLPADHKGRQAG